MKFIDLFAGIGGFRLAMESVGATCVFSSEWDKFAQLTYKANFGETPAGDITKIDAEDIPPHDVLCAGFPCQAFSIAGYRKGFEDTRGTMFFEIARIAKHHKPKVLFLENVRGLLSHDKGKTFQVILETLQDLGYKVHYKVLKSKDFGVPQLRPRLFIIAINQPIDFNFPEPLNIKTCVGDVLETEVASKYFLSTKMWQGLQQRKRFNKQVGNGFSYNLVNDSSSHANTLTARYGKDGAEALVKSDREKRYLNVFDKQSENIGTLLTDANENLLYTNVCRKIATFGKRSQGYGIYSADGLAVTLCARGGGLAGHTGAYLVDDTPRKLTPRECARLQGYPDTFIIPVSDTQAYKQFGNSVTVNVVKAIAQNIKETYEKIV